MHVIQYTTAIKAQLNLPTDIPLSLSAKHVSNAHHTFSPSFENKSWSSVYLPVGWSCPRNMDGRSVQRLCAGHQTDPRRFERVPIRRVSRFNITHVKRAHKARTCWCRRPFHLIYRYQVKEKHF